MAAPWLPVGQVADIPENYDSLAELLGQFGFAMTVAELHGGLCGIFCAGGRDAAPAWLAGLLDESDADEEVLAEFAGLLETFSEKVWMSLRGHSFEFSPLLPDDESGIDNRAEALGLWCHGFLAGLVIGGMDFSSNNPPLKDELAELVHDFAQISRAGADTAVDDDPEETEGSFTELVEYVRVGAQYFFDERDDEVDSIEARTLH